MGTPHERQVRARFVSSFVTPDDVITLPTQMARCCSRASL